MASKTPTDEILSKEKEEILRPLTMEEIDELLELYRKKYGINNFHYILMYNQCKWNRQLTEINANPESDKLKWIAFRKAFYTHRSKDFRNFGTYVSLHMDTMQSVSFHSWQPDFKEMFECLNETGLIDWKMGPLLTNVDLNYCEQVKEIAASKGASVQRARTCHGLIMSHEKALNLELAKAPVGFEMRPLQQEHANRIHSLWPNKKEGSLQYVEGLIQLNRTLGLFQESDNSLVAWIFQNDFSGLGILQVLPEVQRKGFGSLLASHLSKQIAELENVQLSAWIVIENFKSDALLGKIGFEKSVINEWIQLNKF